MLKPIPNGEMATRKMILPKDSSKKRVLFVKRKIPTRIWPMALKVMINDI